eukprot:gnl/Trimastix_PCT/707.p3 GENE.gnl/Trimastix_PCT/707~~gnl/Trimastix_PCT/707.p3  ORF type:complete len:245 (+),score=48.90 gnl/Trimastix_PCT/707:919-1653(+)
MSHFFQQHPSLCKASQGTLLGAATNTILHLELAAYIDCGTILARMTYSLEGDSCLVFAGADVMQRALAELEAFHFPSLTPLLPQIPPAAHPVAQQFARNIVQPVIDEFKAQLEKRRSPFAMLKLARLLDPERASQLRPTPLDVTTILPIVPAGWPIDRAQIVAEIPEYLRRASTDACDDVMDWWCQHAVALPALAKLARFVATLQTSSAAAERAFSVFRGMFKHTQASAYIDLIESSMMASMNK